MTTYMPKSEAEQLRVCHLLESMNCSYQITHGSLEEESKEEWS